MHLIETRDLCYTYPGNVTALHHVNFIAPRKARIAVIGSNGAGKSTLFKHFNGIFKPTSGSVLVQGEPITKENIRNVRKFVGIVFQNPDDQIFSPTVEQDVAFGPTNLGLDEETVQHRVEEALHIVGIEHLANRVPHHLSGGEKKRVAIAGVVAMEPQVLVLDEPTAGLDPQGVRDFNHFCNSLSQKYGLTVIFSTHDVSLVPEIADYVYVMNKGSIMASGTIEEIFVQMEMLQSVRLDVPVLPKLIRSLQEHGVDINMGYTFEEVEKVFLEAFGKRA
jgi:cobalt/nickel transport system ATP-binding protein